MIITVLTPTYNRAHTLPYLFKSMQKQTSFDFEWLIVDDGSEDSTRSLIDRFISETPFPIRYLNKKNGGKHSAINYGILDVKSELTFVVDSDDELLPDAIQTIISCHNKYKDNAKIGVFSFLRCYKNGMNMLVAPQDELVSNYIECRIKGNLPGDMAEVFRTEALQLHQFPTFEGEHFLSEDIVWIEISKKFDCVFYNKPIYQCEYRSDGLTANDKKVKFSSPLGSMMRGKQLMSPECGFKANIKGAIIYNCYAMKVKHDLPNVLILRFTREKALVLITKVFGLIYYKKWTRQAC